MRYVTYSAELAQRICDEIASGRSLRAICAEPAMPDRHTVARWLADPAHAEFRSRYETARRFWCDAIADDLVDRAAQALDVAREADAKGQNANAAVQALKLEIDTIRWTLSKLRPEKFGDKISAELTGAGGKDLIPAGREQRLPQLVAALAVLLPGRDNGELFDLAGALLDRLPGGGGQPAFEHGK